MQYTSSPEKSKKSRDIQIFDLAKPGSTLVPRQIELSLGVFISITLQYTNIAGWNITIFNRKYIFNPGAPIFQPAMLVYQSVPSLKLT